MSTLTKFLITFAAGCSAGCLAVVIHESWPALIGGFVAGTIAGLLLVRRG
jgi:uncharacterized membrane protein YjjP (DUF1212 family)